MHPAAGSRGRSDRVAREDRRDAGPAQASRPVERASTPRGASHRLSASATPSASSRARRPASGRWRRPASPRRRDARSPARSAVIPPVSVPPDRSRRPDGRATETTSSKAEASGCACRRRTSRQTRGRSARARVARRARPLRHGPWAQAASAPHGDGAGIPRPPARARGDVRHNTMRGRSAPNRQEARPPGSDPNHAPGCEGMRFRPSWERLLRETRVPGRPERANRTRAYPRSTNRSVPPASQRLHAPPTALAARATEASSTVQ